MICSNCLMKRLEKDRKKAMKRYTNKLKKDKYKKVYRKNKEEKYEKL